MTRADALSTDSTPHARVTRIRVTALISMEGLSGPGRQLAALAVAAREHGIDYSVAILHRTGNPTPAFVAALDALGIEAFTIRDDGPLDARIPGRLREVLRRDRTDVLQTHGYKATAAAWFLGRTGFNIPWVGFFHGETHEGTKARFYHAIDRRFLLAADRAVVMSARQKQSIGPNAEHVVVIHNAITNFERRTRGSDADRINALCSSLPRPRIGVIGRLSPEKGVDVFLDACSMLKQQKIEFRAIIAGDGPSRNGLEVRAGPLRQHVVFAGHVEDVAALYENIELLVIPSRSEGLPNVLLEAIGYGLPVVSTEVGAVAEVLDDARAGLIVPTGDAGALAGAIRQAITTRYDRDGRDARRRIAERFSLETRTRRIAGLVREIARRTPVS